MMKEKTAAVSASPRSRFVPSARFSLHAPMAFLSHIPHGHHGSRTGICYWQHCLCCLVHLLSAKEEHRTECVIKGFEASKEIYVNIFKVGISAFLLDGFMVITGLLFNNYSMGYGDSVVAGFGISQRVIQIVDFVGMSFSMGAVPLIAYAYSAGNQERLMEIIRKIVLYMLGITLGLPAVLFILRAQVIGIFSIDPEVIAIGQIGSKEVLLLFK